MNIVRKNVISNIYIAILPTLMHYFIKKENTFKKHDSSVLKDKLILI